jgi:DNA-directed RNA polymerase subunit RPC12/RpoP
MKKLSRDEMRAELKNEAMAAIDDLLEWEKTQQAAVMVDVEDKVLRLRKRLGQRMAEVVLQGREAVQPEGGVVCPRCRKRMRFKGGKKGTVPSRLGAVRLERGYYHCSDCSQGIFPPR